MTSKSQKAVLLQTLFVNGGHRIQQGSEAELLCFNDTNAFVSMTQTLSSQSTAAQCSFLDT